MEQLDPDKFFRTNRQTIINIESIVKIEPYFQNKVIVHIKPEHKEKILVSKEKWASFKLWSVSYTHLTLPTICSV